MEYNYKFVNKATGEELGGNMTLAGQGYDEFTLSNGEVTTVGNPNMNAEPLISEKYDIFFNGNGQEVTVEAPVEEVSEVVAGEEL